jgi:hypothetical protein
MRVMTVDPRLDKHEAMRGPWDRRKDGDSDPQPRPVVALVDEMLACYIAWREDAAAVKDAYRGWSDAPADQEAWRFSVYLAAIEQEESADASYAEVVGHVERWLRVREAVAPLG